MDLVTFPPAWTCPLMMLFPYRAKRSSQRKSRWNLPPAFVHPWVGADSVRKDPFEHRLALPGVVNVDIDDASISAELKPDVCLWVTLERCPEVFFGGALLAPCLADRGLARRGGCLGVDRVNDDRPEAGLDARKAAQRHGGSSEERADFDPPGLPGRSLRCTITIERAFCKGRDMESVATNGRLRESGASSGATLAGLFALLRAKRIRPEFVPPPRSDVCGNGVAS